MKIFKNNRNTAPPSGLTTVILNDSKKKPAELKKIISAMSTHNILIEKSGFIFNSSIIDNTLYIGILPYFIEGQRTRHYDIELPEQSKCLLYGFVNSNETLDLMFKPDKSTYLGEFLPDMAELFSNTYIRLARFLIENGFAEHFCFDFGTENIFGEIKLFNPIPETILDLASHEAPFDSNHIPG